MKKPFGFATLLKLVGITSVAAAAPTKEPPVFAFVALRKAELPSEEQLKDAIREFVSSSATVRDFKIDDNILQFAIDGNSVSVALMPGRIPWGDLEGPCATSWLWPEATSEMKGHTAHTIVLLTGWKGGLVERCIFLTKILAAMTRAADAVGVYWGHGSVVLSSKLIQEQAKDASLESPPLFAWIEFRIRRNSDRTVDVLTTGLSYFSCMEIEVIASKRTPDEVMQLVTSVATMELGGDKFKDGDTVGPDAATKIKTHHANSVWPRKESVLRIGY